MTDDDIDELEVEMVKDAIKLIFYSWRLNAR